MTADAARVTAWVETDAIRLAWHDATCPEAEDCRDRALHALGATAVTDMILPRFLRLLADAAPGDGEQR